MIKLDYCVLSVARLQACKISNTLKIFTFDIKKPSNSADLPVYRICSWRQSCEGKNLANKKYFSVEFSFFLPSSFFIRGWIFGLSFLQGFLCHVCSNLKLSAQI